MNFDSLKEFMDQLSEEKVPGNGISVYLNNKNVFSYSSGYSSIEQKRKMTCDDYIYIYSCSKVTTMVATLQLLEQKKLDINDRLSKYIPEYEHMIIEHNGIKNDAKNPITIMQLINMTSGLTYDRNKPFIKEAYKKTNGKMDTLEVIKCLSKEPLSFEPGTHWQYGFGHDVLAAVIEVITKMKYRDYVKKYIFEPLEMNNSFFHADGNIKEIMANEYIFVTNEEMNSFDTVKAQMSKSNSNGKIINVNKENECIFGEEYDSGGAGIITTVNDYIKLCCALSNNGIGLNGNRILSKESIDKMKINTLNKEQILDFNWPQLKGYGYGYGVRTLMDKEAANSTGNIGEFGWGGAAGATVLIDSSINLAVFYAHHMLNPLEDYYQPRLRNLVYSCINK